MPILHQLTVTGHPTFAFWPTVWSHGWCELAPFSVDPLRQTLERILELPEGNVVKLVMQGKASDVEVLVLGPSGCSPEQLALIEATVRQILSMDTDVSALHEMVRNDRDLAWIATSKAGRLLRSPTVFEDLVKTICTTNTTWKQTRTMVQRLCASLGAQYGEGECGFPTPHRLAQASPEVLRAAGLGYRGPYLLELATGVSTGLLEVEGWIQADAPSPELAKTIARVRGVGSYASANMLRLLGRTDHTYVETWMLRTFSAQRNAGLPVTGSDVVDYYARFGPWQGVVLWLDLMGLAYGLRPDS